MDLGLSAKNFFEDIEGKKRNSERGHSREGGNPECMHNIF